MQSKPFDQVDLNDMGMKNPEIMPSGSGEDMLAEDVFEFARNQKRSNNGPASNSISKGSEESKEDEPVKNDISIELQIRNFWKKCDLKAKEQGGYKTLKGGAYLYYGDLLVVRSFEPDSRTLSTENGIVIAADSGWVYYLPLYAESFMSLKENVLPEESISTQNTFQQRENRKQSLSSKFEAVTSLRRDFQQALNNLKTLQASCDDLEAVLSSRTVTKQQFQNAAKIFIEAFHSRIKPIIDTGFEESPLRSSVLCFYLEFLLKVGRLISTYTQKWPSSDENESRFVSNYWPKGDVTAGRPLAPLAPMTLPLLVIMLRFHFEKIPPLNGTAESLYRSLLPFLTLLKILGVDWTKDSPSFDAIGKVMDGLLKEYAGNFWDDLDCGMASIDDYLDGLQCGFEGQTELEALSVLFKRDLNRHEMISLTEAALLSVEKELTHEFSGRSY